MGDIELDDEFKNIAELVMKGKNHDVIREADILMEKYGEQAILLYMKGDAYFKLEEYDNALKYLEQSLKLNSSNGLAWFEKGMIMGKLGLMDSCLSSLDLASNLLEDPTIALFAKGDLLIEDNRYSEALRTFDKLLSMNPTHEDSYFKKGHCLLMLERYEEALSAFNMVLEIDDTNNFDFPALGCKIDCLIHLNRLKDALDANDIALEIAPTLSGAWCQRARIFALVDDMEEAIFCVNKALEYNPNDISALKLKNMLIDFL